MRQTFTRADNQPLADSISTIYTDRRYKLERGKNPKLGVRLRFKFVDDKGLVLFGF